MPETNETPPEPQSGAALLAKIRPRFREESTQICLRPDLLEAWEEANSALSQAQVADATAGRLASGTSTDTKKLAEKVAKIEAEIEESAIMFRFRAMAKDRWQEIVDAHPPRPRNDMDTFSGYNRDAVLDAAIRECIVDPVFDDCEKPGCDHSECGSWQQFTASCNPSEWLELRNTVNSVNRSVVDAPKSVLASQILSSRGSGSRPPKRGA